MNKIKVGLAGYGMAAKVMHAPFLATMQEFEVISVFERHKEESRQLFAEAKVVRSMEELLKCDAELIVITTPNDTHFSYAKLALEAGKHVVLEKPFTITSEDARQLIEIAEKANKVLSVFQNRRYVSDFLTIKEIVEKKLLGEIHEFEGHFYRYRPEAKEHAWREEAKPGSGVLYDLGAHLADQALYLFGLPKTITADIRMQRPHAKADDYFDLRLDYGFTKIILKSSMLVREPGPRYVLHGTKGSFIKYGDDPQEERLKAGELPVSETWGLEDENFYGLLHTELNGNVVREKYPSHRGNFGLYYKNLYETLKNEKPLKEKPEHGFNTIRIIELAFESYNKKQTIECKGLWDAAYND